MDGGRRLVGALAGAELEGNQAGRSNLMKAQVSQSAGKPTPTRSGTGKTNPATACFQEEL